MASPDQQRRGRQRPSSLTIIPPGGTLSALRPLPVEALRLPDGVVGLLHQLGVYAVGQLERLPRPDLTSRFGPELIRRWDQATGRLAELLPAHPRPPELETERSLEHPTARRDSLEWVLKQLLDELSRMLVGCGRGALRIECRLDCTSTQAVDLSVGLFQPTAMARHLFELVRMQLERVRLPGPVAAVRIRAAATAPFEPREQELFPDGRSPKHSRGLGRLVDRLAGRLGRHAVLRPRLAADAQPERACRYEPLVDQARAANARRGRLRRARRADLPPRPLRLLGRPIPLVAVSIVPDGPPLQFRLDGRPERITQTWGPERIETGWWRGRPVRRDYYRVETTTGRRYWLFRRLDDGRWFLHGTFE